MPTPLYIVACLIVLVAACAGTTLGIALAARLLRGRWLNRRRFVLVTGVVVLLRVAGMGVQSLDEPYDLLATLVVVGLNFLLIAFVVMRFADLHRWRATVAVVLGFALGGVLAMAPLFAMRATFLETLRASTGSMTPALREQDRFAVDHTMTPRRWDIVAYEGSEKSALTYVSRLVGLPGERIEIVAEQLTINGVPIEQPAHMLGSGPIPYVSRGEFNQDVGFLCSGCEGAPLTLGKDEFFVLSDNTGQAIDSRYLSPYDGRRPGAIPRSAMRGVVRFRYSPWERRAWFR